jgi:hypothetical protein
MKTLKVIIGILLGLGAIATMAEMASEVIPPFLNLITSFLILMR